MDSQKYFVPGILILIVVISAGIIINQKGSFSPNGLTNTSKATVKAVTTSEKMIKDASAAIGYSIEVQYPQVSGLADSSTQNTINAALKVIATGEINKFKTDINNADKTIPNIGTSQLIISNKVSLASQNAVSVWFSVLNSQPGMAHPNNYNLVYNYDVGAKKVMQLSDLFTPGSDYVQRLSDIAKNDIIAQPELQNVEGLQFFADQGAGPKADNFKLFNLSKDSLLLIFNPATVAPDFAGTRTVSIPLSEIKNILFAPPVTP